LDRGRREETFLISTAAGGIPTAVHYPERLPAPVIVCCHGLFSAKDSSKFVSIGEEWSRQGFVVFRFDFPGCGESRVYPGPDLLSGRVRDLHAVLEHVSTQPWFDGRIGLLGSSLGGTIALLVAASGNHPVRALVCWATPFDLHRLKSAVEEWDVMKELYPAGFSLGSPVTLESLSPVPGVLVLHGRQDESVPWQDAGEIYLRAPEPKRLVLLETGDHRLLDPECRRLALKISRDWLVELGLRPGGENRQFVPGAGNIP